VSWDAGRAALPVGIEGHRTGGPAPTDGEETHRAKLAHARRQKRPACETELPARDTPEGAEELDTGSATPNADAVTQRRPVLDRELFETLIVRAWTKTLKGPYDWADWPLARYTFEDGLLDAVEEHRGLSATALARACAMVACGRAARLRSMDPQPRLDPDGSPLTRADGAAAWRCNLRRDALVGPQLHYWICPGGRIEFDAVTALGESACTQDRPWRG
jgi:hypothetical protein